MRWVLRFGSAIILLSALAFLGTGMARADGRIVASAMSGVLVDARGAPQEGLAVTRTWNTGSEQGEDTVVSDAAGRFAFEEVSLPKGFLTRFFPGQASVAQEFSLPDRGKQLMILNKTNFDRDGELDGTPLSVVCDTEAEPGTDGTFFWGTCRPAG